MSFNAGPLTDPIDPRAVAEFVRVHGKVRDPRPALTWLPAGCVSMLGLFIVAVLGMLSIFGGIRVGFTPQMLVPIVLVAAVIIGTVILARARAQKRNADAYRISQFAAANGMSYLGTVDNRSLPGMIFRRGHDRTSSQVVRGNRPRFVEFGNYEYRTKAGEDGRIRRWGYVAIKLDVPLPNIVLDALGNNSVLGTNLPSAFQKHQRLALEGDFGRHFALYCPQGYEQDALYLFTPDVMARFIDNAAQLDAEIVDDWLFLYQQGPVTTADPATWARLLGTVDAVMIKLDQWARWRDDRLRLAQGADAAPQPPAPVLPPNEVNE